MTRSWTRDNLDALEEMSKAAETLLSSDTAMGRMPANVRDPVAAAYAEQSARDGFRTTFRTVAGRRDSAIEATAIWEAEKYLKASKPNISLKACKVEANRPSPERPFVWTVTFTDPKDDRRYVVHTSFSPGSVRSYITANP